MIFCAMNAQKKAEYEKIQNNILKSLFEAGTSKSLIELCKLTGKPASETQYHCEELLGKHLVTFQMIGDGVGTAALGCGISAQGRKKIMEE